MISDRDVGVQIFLLSNFMLYFYVNIKLQPLNDHVKNLVIADDKTISAIDIPLTGAVDVLPSSTKL